MPKAGLYINSDGHLIPLSNTLEDEFWNNAYDAGTADDDGEFTGTKPAVKTYRLQDNDHDSLLKGKYGKHLQAYILDYQVVTMGSVLMYDGSDEAEEIFGGNADLATMFNYLVSGGPTGSSDGGNQGSLIGNNQERVVQLAQQELDLWNGGAKDIAKFGCTSGDDWCGCFAGYILKTATDISPPGGYAIAHNWTKASGDLEFISGGDHISPGDFVIYDANNNGIADHINIYVGNGQVIGGNQGNGNVTQGSMSGFGNILGHVRVKN